MTGGEPAVKPHDGLPSVDLCAEIECLIRQIPKGRVCTVTQLALALGDVSASKAVCEVIRDMPFSEAVPLHRVVMADGSLATSDVEDAQCLLEREGLIVLHGQVRDLERKSFQDLRCKEPLTELRALQLRVAEKAVQTEWLRFDVKEVGGVDVAYEGCAAYSCCTVLDHEQRLLREAHIQSSVTFPYISTYLTFREGPSILGVVEALPNPPDILLINGSGIAHPRGCGLATHIGVMLDIPTIGVTTRLLAGKARGGKEDGTSITYRGKKVGAVLQTGIFRPIYVSPGHMVSVDSSYRIVKAFTGQHRLPEPIWQAHVRARAFLESR